MSKMKCWVVSAMIGFGKSAQYVMSDSMTYCDAYEFTEDLIHRAEDGHWVEIGHTFVNPKNITTIRVVKERPDLETYGSANNGER